MDLISREAVANCVDNMPSELTEDGRRMIRGIRIKEFIADCPSAFEGMTNGEVIKALFPDSYFLNDFPFEVSSMEKIYIDNNKDNKTHIMAQEDWWNAPYKAESEDKE